MRSALVIAIAISSVACGGGRNRVRHPPQARAADASVGPTSSSTASDAAERDVPTVDLLATRGPSDAPQMRETLRVRNDAATRPTEIKITSADSCVRAIVTSSAPSRAWLEDDAHVLRGESASIGGAGATSLVPPRGPACARKGETLRLVVESSSTRAIAHAVVWQSP